MVEESGAARRDECFNRFKRSAEVHAAQRRAQARRAIVGDPPAALENDAVAVDCWNRVCAHLDAMGILATTDGDTLAAYAITWARWVRAALDIRERGETETVRDRTGNYVSKIRSMVRVEADLAARLHRLAGEFGLTPAARAGLSVREVVSRLRPH